MNYIGFCYMTVPLGKIGRSGHGAWPHQETYIIIHHLAFYYCPDDVAPHNLTLPAPLTSAHTTGRWKIYHL